MKPSRHKDLTGQIFGHITVLSFSKTIKVSAQRYSTYWKCKDVFGFEKELTSAVLLSGQAKSCGGLRQTSIGNKHPRWKGHGELGMGRFYQIKNGAKVRGIDFRITVKQAWEAFQKQNKKCAFTGMELVLSTGNLDKNGTASLDRIDSSKGYTVDNIQWVHKHINMMKLDYDQKYFIEMCQKVADYARVSNIN